MRKSSFEEALKLMKDLDIPSYSGVKALIEARVLADIFNDPEKLEILIFKLKNRAFM